MRRIWRHFRRITVLPACAACVFARFDRRSKKGHAPADHFKSVSLAQLFFRCGVPEYRHVRAGSTVIRNTLPAERLTHAPNALRVSASSSINHLSWGFSSAKGWMIGKA